MAKICMASVQHSPQDDRIFFKEALSLQKAGFELCQVCVGDEQGRVYDIGESTCLNPDGSHELVFNAIPTTIVAKPAGGFEKLKNKFFQGRFVQTYIEALLATNADVYHAHEPISYYLCLKASKRSGAKVVFDAHESWKMGTPKEDWIRKHHLHRLKYLITANHLTRGFLTNLNPNLASCVIYNAAEERLFSTTTPGSAPIIVHDGYLPFNRGLKKLVESIRLLKQDVPEVKLKIVGATRGQERAFLQEQINRHQLEDTIEETGWLPYQEVATAMSGAAIGVIAKEPVLNNIIGGPPIKYFNYTAAGLAIVDVNMPETTRLLNKYQNGVSVKVADAKTLSSAFKRLITDRSLLRRYQSNSKKAFAQLNWSIEAEKLVRFYKEEVLNDESILFR